VLVVSSVLLGTVFGSLEVATIAFAQRAGAGGWAGALLGLIAFGSMVAGLWYGIRRWRWDLAVRYRISLLTLAVGGLPALVVPNVALMAPASLLVGLSIAPTLIASSGLVARIMPELLRTEGFSWQSASINIGAAAGSAIAGLVVDAWGPRAAFAVGPLAAMLGALVALVGTRWLLVATPAIGYQTVDAA
jgi:MFS family permease